MLELTITKEGAEVSFTSHQKLFATKIIAQQRNSNKRISVAGDGMGDHDRLSINYMLGYPVLAQYPRG